MSTPKPTTKRCVRCDENRPPADFWRDHQPCRACRREYNRRWVKNNPEAKAAANRRYREKYPQRVAQAGARARRENPQKDRARKALYEAIARGAIERGPCAVCGLKPRIANGANRIHGHHYLGYAKENHLKVKWLCRSCHAKEHREK